MIKHHNTIPTLPQRVVVLGASGFIGKALVARLQTMKVAVLALSSSDVNLCDQSETIKKFRTLIQPTDAIVFLSVIGPNRSRDSSVLIENIKMAENIAVALQQTPCAQLIYVSSEAVYSFEDTYIDVHTKPSPTNLYGVMHLARELVLQEKLEKILPLMIFRLTQVYGEHSTHNAYGPNRFVRQAHANKAIDMYGKGEEHRDFIYIADVIDCLLLALQYNSAGLTNLASGSSVTYEALAQELAGLFTDEKLTINSQPRQVAITHRYFDVSDLKAAYPTLQFSPLRAGLIAMLQRECSYEC